MEHHHHDHHHHHSHHGEEEEELRHHSAPPPPPYHHHTPPPTVQHVAHQVPHHGQPEIYPPPPFHHHPEPPNSFQRQRTVRIFPKADEGYSLTIREGQVVLAKADHNDPYQHWIKDEKYSTRVKDKDGHPSFALINMATGEAIKHSIGETHPVRLIRYNPDYLDESVLWTESKDTGGGFHGIRMVNNIKLNFDAFHGDSDHGGVRDGTLVVLWDWWKGDNELWKIVPY